MSSQDIFLGLTSLDEITLVDPALSTLAPDADSDDDAVAGCCGSYSSCGRAWKAPVVVGNNWIIPIKYTTRSIEMFLTDGTIVPSIKRCIWAQTLMSSIAQRHVNIFLWYSPRSETKFYGGEGFFGLVPVM
jgi:hypothetical protein